LYLHVLAKFLKVLAKFLQVLAKFLQNLVKFCASGPPPMTNVERSAVRERVG